MVNKICENISTLIYLIGDKNQCKSDADNIDAFINVLIPKKGENECLSDIYLRKLIKGEVKDMELTTLFSIAYSFNISMEKFILSKDKFKKVYENITILPKQQFDLYDNKLKKQFIIQLQSKLKDISKKKAKLNKKKYKYFLSKEYQSKYMLEILSKKNKKLIRVNTLIKVLESIEYKEIDTFMKELYNSWSNEIDIYYKKGGCK